MSFVVLFQKTGIAMLIALLTVLGRHATAAELIRIGTWDNQSDLAIVASNAVLKRAYSKLNQPFEFVELPIRRAFFLLTHDQLDANVHRTAPIFSNYPQLVQVPTPINTVSIRGYVRQGYHSNVARWSDTKGLVVTYPRGTLMFENKLPTTAKHVAAASINEMFRMVERSTADIAIVAEPAGSPAHPWAAVNGLVRLAPALDQTPLYHALSGQHRDLAVRLNAVLEQMRDSGEMQDIQKRALATHTN